MGKSRTQYSLRNSSVALFSQIISIVLSFATRTIFIQKLGAEYLGINGLFSNILTMLSLAEMGIGTAIIYAMYRPLAEENKRQIAALMNLYKKLYNVIGIVVAILGISLVPFLDVFIKERPDIPYLEGIYLLYLLNTVASYFFTYKRSIIIADQKGYLSNLNTTIFLILQNIIQIILLFITGNFYLFLITQILCTLVSNIAISVKANKMYPYLSTMRNEKVSKEDKVELSKSVVGMMSSKIGSVVVNGTDNLLISAFVGIYTVGLYSNYKLIVNTVKTLFVQCVSALTASVGNLNATDNKEKSRDVFWKIDFLNYSLAFFGTLYLFYLINPFIELWIGKNYTLSVNIVAALVLDFYVVQMRQTPQIYINTYGLFWKIKWKSIIEAAINLTASVFLMAVLNMGVFGILLGTLISNVATNLWWEPFVVFKNGLEMPFHDYLILYLRNIIILLIAMTTTHFAVDWLNNSGIFSLAIRFIIITFVGGGVFLVANCRRVEFKYYIQLFIRIIKKEV